MVAKAVGRCDAEQLKEAIGELEQVAGKMIGEFFVWLRMRVGC